MIINLNKEEYPSITTSETVDLSKIVAFWKKDNENSYLIQTNNGITTLIFSKSADRDRAYENMVKIMSQETKQNTNIMNKLTDDIKSFISENRQTIYWIGLIFLIDHFFLNGSLRSKLKDTVEGMLSKINKDTNKA